MHVKIRNIVDIQIGYQFRRKVEHLSGGTHRVIQIKDFDDENRLNTSALFRVTPEHDVDRYLVNKGDVLFLSRGQRNYAFAIMSDLERTIAAGYFFILRKKSDSILPEYLAWTINQAPAQRYLKHMARRGTHMPIIGKSEFGQLRVSIPDLKTQKIVVRLSALQQRESLLLEQIQKKRSRLLQEVCLKAVRRER